MSSESQHPMRDLAIAAFQQSAKRVIRLAIETNTPIIVYENGKVVKLDPHTMQPMEDESPSKSAIDTPRDE
jgi:hypothetical protein